MTPSFERLVVAALAWGAVSFGAVYPWAYWPLAVVCAGLGAYAIVITRAWLEPRPRHLGIALGTVAVAITIQLVALPSGLAQTVSPAFDRFFRQYALAYHPASQHALSIAPSATLVALLLFVALALLLIGLISAMRSLSLEWLVNQVMGLGVALAIVGVVQRALIEPGNPMVYGFWQPELGGSPGLRASNPFGPFINRNHFAGWMVMALPLVVAYSYFVLQATGGPRRRRWSDRLRWVATVDASRFLLVACSAMLMSTAVVLSASRSGIASLVVAMAVLFYFVLRDSSQSGARWLVAAYLVVIVGGSVAWAGTDETIGRFLEARTDSSGSGRVMAWRDTTRIISDFPLSGTGLGTYGQAMLVYQSAGRPVMYAQAHNEYLQLLAEGGALVVVPTLVVVILVLLGLRRRLSAGTDDLFTKWIRAGAVAGLAGIAAQSLVEFSLQMPGNRVLFVLLLAIALHRARSGRTGSHSRRLVPHSNAHRV